MRHKVIAFSVIVAFSAVGLAISAKPAPKQVVIDKCKKKKKAVTLTHEKHIKILKIPCKKCHHKGTPDKPCSSCHAGKMKGKNPGCAEMSPKKNPFHISCMGCHKKLKKGPSKCKQCHK